MTAYALQAAVTTVPANARPYIKSETVTEVLAALMGRARASAADFEPQHVANTLWAIAKIHRHSEDTGHASPVVPLRHSVVHLADVVAAAKLHNFTRFSPQNVANILWALAVLGHRPPDGVLAAAGIHFGTQPGSYRP